MPRVAIYVSQALKVAMDMAERHRPNWSFVAQKSFEAEIKRLNESYREVKKKTRRG